MLNIAHVDMEKHVSEIITVVDVVNMNESSEFILSIYVADSINSN